MMRVTEQIKMFSNSHHCKLYALATKDRTKYLKDLKQPFVKRSKKSKGNEKRRTILNSLQTLDERSRVNFDTTSTRVIERKAVYTASLSSSRVSQARASNRSKKSAYERDGCVPEIPDHKLESIPSELLTVANMLGDEHLLVMRVGL